MKKLIEAIQTHQAEIFAKNKARRDAIEKAWSAKNDGMFANKDRNGAYHAPIDGYEVDGEFYGKGQFIPMLAEFDERDGLFFGSSGSSANNPRTRIKMPLEEAQALIEPLKALNVAASTGKPWGDNICYLYLEAKHKSILNLIEDHYQAITEEAKANRKAEFEALHAAKVAASDYVGEVGKRRDFNVTVTRVHAFEGQSFGYYDDGLRVIVEMMDAEQNVLIYIGNGNIIGNQGETVTVKATVKEHSEYKGLKQTKINRPKVQ